jgi:Nif-specific regulatory protein
MGGVIEREESRSGISDYYRGIEPGQGVVCAQTGELAPDMCQANRASVIKDALLTGLRVIERILAANISEQRRFSQILEVLEREFGLLRGTIMLLDTDRGTLRLEALLADEDQSPSKRETYRRGEGITGRVLETGIAAVVPDIAGDPEFADRIHRRRERGRAAALAFVCVPIRLEQEVIGTLAADRESGAPLDLADTERILSVVAGLIAHDVQLAREAAARQERLSEENLRLRAALGERIQPENIVGSSAAMRAVYTRVALVAPTPMTVLIRGESGTGKELVASAIHYASSRRNRPVVRVHCAALNENLLESELFGHERGAFTGATQRRIGRIEEAEGGTLFLDEVGEFPLTMQVKVLRVLQEREYQRVGSNQMRHADIRIITATNRDLEAEVGAGRFRQDLFYRIQAFPIHIPPLRGRREDILALANHFLRKHGPLMAKSVHRISTPAIDALMAYHWPGNVRELEHAIQYALVLSRDGVIHSHDLPPTLALPDGQQEGPPAGSLTSQVERLERDLISDAIKRSSGNLAGAARELGVTPRILRYKAHRLAVRTT